MKSNFCFILWKLRKDELSEHLGTRSLAKLKTRTTCKHLIPLFLKYFFFIICECLESERINIVHVNYCRENPPPPSPLSIKQPVSTEHNLCSAITESASSGGEGPADGRLSLLAQCCAYTLRVHRDCPPETFH